MKLWCIVQAIIRWCRPVLACLIFTALARRRIGLCESWVVFEALGTWHWVRLLRLFFSILPALEVPGVILWLDLRVVLLVLWL